MDFSINMGLMLHDRNMLSHSIASQILGHVPLNSAQGQMIKFGTIYAMRIVSPPVLIGE